MNDNELEWPDVIGASYSRTRLATREDLEREIERLRLELIKIEKLREKYESK